MTEKRIVIGTDLPNIPWEDRPPGSPDPVWRYSKNPVIPRDAIPTSNSIFNSAVIPYNNRFVGVFRCDDKHRRLQLHYGESDDGLNWRIDPTPLFLKEGTRKSPLTLPLRSPHLQTGRQVLYYLVQWLCRLSHDWPGLYLRFPGVFPTGECLFTL